MSPAIGRAPVVQQPPVDDEIPTFGWLLLNGLMSIWPLLVLLGLVAGGLALAGALGVG